MRYRDTGNVHKDFQLATEATIRYALESYGPDFLSELFARTAQLIERTGKVEDNFFLQFELLAKGLSAVQNRFRAPRRFRRSLLTRANC